MPLTELLPEGIAPVWSPFDSEEAAAILLAALLAEQAEPE